MASKLRSHEPVMLAMEVSTLVGTVRDGWMAALRKTTKTDGDVSVHPVPPDARFGCVGRTLEALAECILRCGRGLIDCAGPLCKAM